MVAARAWLIGELDQIEVRNQTINFRFDEVARHVLDVGVHAESFTPRHQMLERVCGARSVGTGVTLHARYMNGRYMTVT